MPEVRAEGLAVLSNVNVPDPPTAMALPELFANWTESAKDVEELQPDGPLMLVGLEGRSKLPLIQPYQKALIGVPPVLSRYNEYSNSLPDVPVSVIVAVAEIVPWAWRLPAANPAATVKTKRLDRVFALMFVIFIYFGFPQLQICSRRLPPAQP